jgi:hypothetical protein
MMAGMRGDLAPVREFKRRAEQALPGRIKKVVLPTSAPISSSIGDGIFIR